MVDMKDMAWCPGCGDFMIRNAVANVLGALPVPRKDIVFVSGIGQAAKMPQYLDVNYFNGLHGRALPVAAGIKMARPELTVIAVSGEGCMYGEGGNHFMHTIRRGLDLTILVCNNRVYALTKGQSSPTTDEGRANALDPEGNHNHPLNPLQLAVVAGAPFVARGFAGDREQLEGIIREAVQFKGTAVVDILQPCVSFNKVNTYQWYQERIYQVQAPVTDPYDAMRLMSEWNSKIPTGILYKAEGHVPRKLPVLFGEKVNDTMIEALLRT